MQRFSQYHNHSIPQAAPTIDANGFDWNTFPEFLQWHHPLLPSGPPLENMLSSEYSTPSAAPIHTGCPNLANTSERSTPVADSSPKKSSTALIRRRYQNRIAQRSFRTRQKEYMEALEQKVQDIVSKYDDLQQKYTTLSIAYETLVNEKVPRKEDGNEDSDTSMLSDRGNFTNSRVSLESDKDGQKEEERSGFLPGYFRNH